MFSHLEPLPADPILGLSALFKADQNPDKVDLGVGVYKTEAGETPIMRSIQEAFNRLAKAEGSKVYIAPTGWAGFTDACLELALGAPLVHSLDGKLGAIQTPGGCGALRLGFELVNHAAPGTTVWVSNPTWANHVPTLKAAGLDSKVYRYYDRSSTSIDIEGMLEDLKDAKAGDLVLLHASCHNPTGADLSDQQWDRVIELVGERGLVPFLDMAYQGFAQGLEVDAGPLRRAFEKLPEAILSYSCSKNFGLYRERTGALIVKSNGKEATKALTTNLARIARENYSMPPSHGAALMTTVMQDNDLRADWVAELGAMRDRVNTLRRTLADSLSQKGFAEQFGAVGRQTGMFSLLNLTPEQVAVLQKDRSIYFPANGRINVAGLTEGNIPYVADAIAGVM
ncbi:MAG: aspartate/tyrosine/aromatic aminotransferase [Alphaproteobacteria bacterium]|nr:aspartate/tyrosine/aromatic aminotransferase [Alphaproteobacteria bacterium]